MTDLELFTYEGHQVRTVLVEGEPWFVLADLCRVLDLTNPSMVAERITSDDLSTTEVIDSIGRTQVAKIVNEPGLYDVVFLSRKPEAVAFRRWITTEVLPAIRKTGSYSLTPAIPRNFVEALRAAADAEEGRIRAEAERDALSPRAAAWDYIASAHNDLTVSQAAKILDRDPAIKTGPRRLYDYLREVGWLFKDQKGNWSAYQSQINYGRVTLRATHYTDQLTGESLLGTPQVRITAKGLAELHTRLGGSAPLATGPALEVVSA